MSTRTIPEGLAAMAPGPELAAVLAGIDTAALAGDELTEVLVAAGRQNSHQRAVMLTALVATADAAEAWAPEGRGQRAGSAEIGAALALSRKAADLELIFAYGVVVRLPQLCAGMLAGLIDERRAEVFLAWTCELPEALAHHVAEVLIPQAAAMSATQLRHKIARMAMNLDPDWARRRYTNALRQKQVYGYRNADGTANLAGYNLEPDRVAAAMTRIVELAKAAKRAGDPRRLDELNAELYLGMLDGSYETLTDRQILTELAKSRPEVDVRPEPAPEPEPAPTHVTGRGVEVRIELGTVLGLDDRPTDLVGWGPLDAATARLLVGKHSGGRWTFTLTGPDGHMVDHGVLGHRPAGYARRRHRYRSVIHLVVPAALLPELAKTADPAWAKVIAELLHHATPAQPEPDEPAAQDDPRRRFPKAKLRARVQNRRARCPGPACNSPVRGGVVDHRHDHAKGGPTTEANLDAYCRRHDDLKTKGGWTITKPDAHTYVWHTVLGTTYTVHARPLIEPLPEPRPETLAEPEDPGLLEGDWQNASRYNAHVPEPKRKPKPAPPPARPRAGPDIPPF